MPAGTEVDPTHLQIIEWTVGIMIVVGGAMIGIVTKMVKGKKNKSECDLIHKEVNNKLDDIKEKLEKGESKIDGMGKTLIEISTILKLRSKNETERYDRHSEGWKNE